MNDKRIMLVVSACSIALMLYAGIRQAQIRRSVIADKVYALQSEYYSSNPETFEEEDLAYEYASEIPSKYYDIPLSGELQQFVMDSCRDLDPLLIFAVMAVESNYNETAVNGSCVGLMQVNVKAHKDRIKRLGVDVNDPQGNIIVGIDILSEYIGKYGLHKGLIAYNCGQNSRTFKKYKTTKYSRQVVRLIWRMSND